MRYELDLNSWNLRIWGVAASGFLTDSYVVQPCDALFLSLTFYFFFLFLVLLLLILLLLHWPLLYPRIKDLSLPESIYDFPSH